MSNVGLVFKESNAIVFIIVEYFLEKEKDPPKNILRFVCLSVCPKRPLMVLMEAGTWLHKDWF